VFDMYGDPRENLLEILAVVIMLSLISSVRGTTKGEKETEAPTHSHTQTYWPKTKQKKGKEIMEMTVPNHPKDATKGERTLVLAKAIYIESDDYRDTDDKDFFGLAPGA